MTDLMIEARDVTKTYGTVRALDEVTLEVPRGTLLGLLGHNGAGKTTLVEILATTLPLTSGSARVAGHDVTRDGGRVRRAIGLTGQFAALDDQLSGTDNLVLLARLLGASPRQARQRAGELLELFELTQAAKRMARTYSGGMRRRLDLAAGLIGHPEVLFLDEPSTGLDPASRVGLWSIIARLVREGTTVLLTTQYLEEADRLADAITVLAQGRVIAAGTPTELKEQVGRRSVTVTVASLPEAGRAEEALRGIGLQPARDAGNPSVTTPIDASREVAVIVRALDDAGVEATGLAMTEPTLDDVYLTLAHGRTGALR